MECTATPVYAIALIVVFSIIGGALLLMYLDGFFSHEAAIKREQLRSYKRTMRQGLTDVAENQRAREEHARHVKRRVDEYRKNC